MQGERGDKFSISSIVFNLYNLYSRSWTCILLRSDSKSWIEMRYHREVKNLLGQECMTQLLNHVMGGNMSDDQLKYFVLHLGELSKTDPEAPNVLYGNHTRRMSRDRDRGQDIEILQVMSDWWENSLFEMTQEAAITALVKALSHPDVYCKPLASTLSTIQNQVV